MSINSVGILNFFLSNVIHMKSYRLQVKMILWSQHILITDEIVFPSLTDTCHLQWFYWFSIIIQNLDMIFFWGNIMEWCLSTLAKIQNCSSLERQLEDIQTKELRLRLQNKPFILVIIAQKFNNLVQAIVKCLVYKFCMIVQCIIFTYLINFLYKK